MARYKKTNCDCKLYKNQYFYNRRKQNQKILIANKTARIIENIVLFDVSEKSGKNGKIIRNKRKQAYA